MTEVMEAIGSQRPVYWKMAADMAELEPAMTDMALSLDIAEEGQIDDFIEKIPAIEDSIKTCAQLLVQTRMGNIDLVAEEVREAMTSMEKVFHALRGLGRGMIVEVLWMHQRSYFWRHAKLPR